MALGEGGGDSGADTLGKKQYIVVLRPIYGGQLGLGLGVQGVKCLAQGGGAATQAVLVEVYCSKRVWSYPAQAASLRL